jgi:hypothetical protein
MLQQFRSDATRRNRIMSKLIALFKTAPTDTNRAKLNTYMNRHMMAVCMLSIEETAYLRANGFKL